MHKVKHGDREPGKPHPESAFRYQNFLRWCDNFTFSENISSQTHRHQGSVTHIVAVIKNDDGEICGLAYIEFHSETPEYNACFRSFETQLKRHKVITSKNKSFY